MLIVHKIARDEVGSSDSGQPVAWTFLDFEAADEDAYCLASSLQNGLDPRGRWYCEFASDTETFVVFADRVFRYPHGDPAGPGEAAVHGRSADLPVRRLGRPE